MKKEVTILVAEDDDGHARLIERNLRRAGILNPIERLSDGEEVIAHFEGLAPSASVPGYLVLLDIRMPKLSGIEVLRWLKNHEVYASVPVIMVTTTEDPQEIKNCHALGCNAYVTKPVDYEQFVSAIRQLGLFLAVIQVPELRGSSAPPK